MISSFSHTVGLRRQEGEVDLEWRLGRLLTGVGVHPRFDQAARVEHVQAGTFAGGERLFWHWRRAGLLRRTYSQFVGGTGPSQCGLLLFELHAVDCRLVLLDAHDIALRHFWDGPIGIGMDVGHPGVAKRSPGGRKYVVIALDATRMDRAKGGGSPAVPHPFSALQSVTHALLLYSPFLFFFFSFFHPAKNCHHWHGGHFVLCADVLVDEHILVDVVQYWFVGRDSCLFAGRIHAQGHGRCCDDARRLEPWRRCQLFERQ